MPRSRQAAPMALSIRAALLGVMALLSLLAASLAGLHAVNAWTVLREAEEAQAADRSANRFASGLHDLLLERLFTGTALQAPAPMPAAAVEEEQGVATREIAGSVQVVARQNDEATRMMQQVQAAVRGTEAQAQAVLATGDGVSAASAELRGQVDDFLATVRAA